MYPKTLTLPRTSIRLFLNDQPPAFGKLLKGKKISQELLDDMLEYEEHALAAGQPGITREDITALLDATRKVHLLGPMLQRRLYFHLLRKGALPAVADDTSFVLLTDAYRQLMDTAVRSNEAPKINRLDGMLLFGHWWNFQMSDESPLDAASYQHWQAVLKQCGRYSHMPGMLAKLDKFAAFADDATAARILKVLQTLRFQHSQIGPASCSYYDYTNLSFWGLCEIVLLNANASTQLIISFLKRLPDLPQSDKQLEIFEQFVAAAANPAARQRFQPLRDQALDAIPPREETVDESRVQEVVNALGITLPKGNWTIILVVSTVPIDRWFYRRNALKGEDLRLEITLGNEGRWKVMLARHDNEFLVTWGRDFQPQVRAEQLKYRRMVKWPHFSALLDLGALIADLERVLNVRFERHFDVFTDAGMTSEDMVKHHGQAITQWLTPFAATVGVNGKVLGN
jgi:hypothetical protein